LAESPSTHTRTEDAPGIGASSASHPPQMRSSVPSCNPIESNALEQQSRCSRGRESVLITANTAYGGNSTPQSTSSERCRKRGLPRASITDNCRNRTAGKGAQKTMNRCCSNSRKRRSELEIVRKIVEQRQAPKTQATPARIGGTATFSIASSISLTTMGICRYPRMR
jgi:hypothetical protein